VGKCISASEEIAVLFVNVIS